jgi:AcrR family transcriptional regulator
MRRIDPHLHAERAQQIRAGAAKAFARNGYANTTVPELRRATGLSTGALFHYFADKAAIFRAIVDAGCTEQRDRLAAIDDSDPLVAFWAVIDVLRKDFTDPDAAGMVGAILERVGTDPELARILADQETVVLRHLNDLIGRLQDQLLMDPSIPAPTAARWIIRVIDGLILHVADDDFDPAAESAVLILSLRRTLQLPE